MCVFIDEKGTSSVSSIFDYNTPVGRIRIEDNGEAVTSVTFVEGDERIPVNRNESPLIREAFYQLDEYFKGKRKSFNLPLCPKGTNFQRRVWQALLKIPYGTVCSYKDIAEEVGNCKAYRAVGGASGKNPIPIIIPCHRVVGNKGNLVGYEGGLEIKRFLLELESKAKI